MAPRPVHLNDCKDRCRDPNSVLLLPRRAGSWFLRAPGRARQYETLYTNYFLFKMVTKSKIEILIIYVIYEK